jgi:hypothetical protein
MASRSKFVTTSTLLAQHKIAEVMETTHGFPATTRAISGRTFRNTGKWRRSSHAAGGIL